MLNEGIFISEGGMTESQIVFFPFFAVPCSTEPCSPAVAFAELLEDVGELWDLVKSAIVLRVCLVEAAWPAEINTNREERAVCFESVALWRSVDIYRGPSRSVWRRVVLACVKAGGR